jgi:hypothetical protein
MLPKILRATAFLAVTAIVLAAVGYGSALVAQQRRPASRKAVPATRAADPMAQRIAALRAAGIIAGNATIDPNGVGPRELRHLLTVEVDPDAKGSVSLLAHWTPQMGDLKTHKPGSGTDRAELFVEVFAPDDGGCQRDPLNEYTTPPVPIVPRMPRRDVLVEIPMPPAAEPYVVRVGVRSVDEVRKGDKPPAKLWRTVRMLRVKVD